MKNLSSKWQKFIAYLTAYLGIVPFLLAGGAILLKSDDESAKKSTKMAFILLVPFLVFDAVMVIVNAFMTYGGYANYTVDYTPVLFITAIVATAKIAFFLIFFLLDAFTSIKFDCIINLFGGNKNAKVVNASKHDSAPAYVNRVRQVKAYDAPNADEAEEPVDAE